MNNYVEKPQNEHTFMRFKSIYACMFIYISKL